VILALVPLVGVLVGLGAWFGLRGFGAMDVLGGAPAKTGWREERRERPQDYSGGLAGVRERIDNLPQGCLWAVIGVSALWVLGWIVLLVIGVSLLS
jgi:hypothetical protein